MDLKELRGELDKIDQQMVELFQKRMDICRDVAEYKIRNGKKVFDKEREQEKLSALSVFAENDFNQHCINDMFGQIMAMSRKLQYQEMERQGVFGRLPFIAVDKLDTDNIRVVYQGVEGAYSQEAMRRFFGEDIQSFHVPKWRDAMECIAEGAADYAVLPIENSSAGVVAENYDLLVEFENYIVGEQIIKCRHALLGVPGATLDGIKTVYSHPQAIAQCDELLNQHRNWMVVPYGNTATAAKKVADDGDRTQAALASQFAGKYFGLDTLVEKAYYNDVNSTRFIVVTNQRIFRKDADKISICFELPHTSGSLYNLLSHIIYNNLNMTRIESRPKPGQNWQYRFFVDIEGNLNDGGVKNALRGIRQEGKNLKILGNY